MALKTYYIPNILEVGIDEAGRGPLFGRLYVGAVILPKDDAFDHSLMKDSKKLSERKRLIAYDYIREYAIDYSTYYVDEEYIDKNNIFQATQSAMHGALDKLTVIPEHILVDGPYFTTYFNNARLIPFTCIESGDNLYTPIAAASIMAKVERDEYIQTLCDENSDLVLKYDLRNNKGYGTKRHIDGILKYGVSEGHRKTFGICKQY